MAWTYQHLVNACLQAAFTLVLSYLVGRTIPGQTANVLKGLSTFLNKICIPVMCLWAIGIKLDLTYEDHWKFVGAFIIQTALFMIVITIQVLLLVKQGKKQRGSKLEVWTEKFGAELVTSSAILGPLALEGALGKEFVPLAFLTTFNTVAVQIPVLQIMLEKVAQSQADIDSEESSESSKNQVTTDTMQPRKRNLVNFDSANQNQGHWNIPLENQSSLPSKNDWGSSNQPVYSMQDIQISVEDTDDKDDNIDSFHTQANVLYIEHGPLTLKEKKQHVLQLFKSIFLSLYYNPIIWSLIVAIMVSVSGLREFLSPESSKFVLETSWIESAFGALGACLTPVSLVLTGLWISQNRIFASCNVWTVMFDLLFKFVVIPVSMIPIAVWLGLKGGQGKASVILSAMPMALVVVPFAQEYNVAVNDLTVNLVLGLVLMLPCVLGMMEMMNKFELFNA